MSALRKEQAQSCLDKAKEFIHKGNFIKAEKFLVKSLKQYPTAEARSLLSNLKRKEAEFNAKARERARQYDQRRRSQPQAQAAPQSDPTEEALKKSKDPEVRRILQEKDYYGIFGLQKGQLEEKVLKKKYRKLAATLHPDRNKDPGAEEAFKKVGRAHECLKDPEKRQVYDRYGTETPEFRNHFHRSYGGHSFEEALFREFAGNGGFNPFFQFHQFNRRAPSSEPREPLTGWRALLQMLTQFAPIILLLSYTFVDTGGSRKYFSLSRTDYFTEQHETPLGTQFFVPRNMMYVPHAVKSMYGQVEGEYSDKLHEDCEQEKRERDELRRKAATMYGEARIKKLRRANSKTSKCEE